ncbi:uncharacterized protein [Cherax quadricarinatus]|uniref:uncharacterized protein n=1 Tax=Cherax quadricarinatus TaxID=27406 RepID=UPI00387EA638
MGHKVMSAGHQNVRPYVRLSAGVVMVVMGVVTVTVTVALMVPLWFYHTPLHQRQDCGTPTDDECLQELLLGSPTWDDPQLLQVLRQEFLIPPEELYPPAPLPEHHLEKVDQELLKVVKAVLGKVNFVVGVTGVSSALVRAVGGNSGLWVDPQPEYQPGGSPLPHLWYSHTCLSSTVPYLNKQQQQCVSLASLLHAVGRPSVDLVLSPTVDAARVMQALCTEYNRPPRVVLVKRTDSLEPLVDQYLDRIVGRHDVGNATFVFFKQ